MIVSLLSLFALVAITFVVSATQYHRAADKYGRVGRYGNDPKYILDSALYQLVCDTTNARSAIQFHGLLADMYGHYGAGGSVRNVEPVAGGQLLRIRLQGDEPRKDNLEFERALKEFGYLGGCVITMLDGPCSGISSHIVQHDLTTLDGNNVLVYVKTFIGDETQQILPAQGNRFWINGQAFTGTGFGYNIETGKLDKQGPAGKSVAMQPNFMNTFPLPVGAVTRESLVQRLLQIEELALFGGANEEFDAPTHHDLALAYIPDPPSGEATAGRSPDPLKPSFHRPDLIQRAGGALDAATLRKITFRPNKQDHPSFTGSNPNFDPLRPPWDVDNDRDGIPEAIWVDLGYPAQMGPDGRMVKPLFAITCVPTNGGIDINAAGNPGHLTAGNGRTPYGMGSGPVDIDLNMLAGGAGGTLFAKLAQGGTLPGKYGKDGRPGAGGAADRTTRFWREKQPAYPHKWLWEPVRMSRGYGSPPDFFGMLQVKLDENDGQPIWTFGVKGGDAAPMFELDTTRDGARGGGVSKAKDPLFSHAEYERFLRQYDHDARMLPSRLWELAQELRPYPKRFSVENYDVPGPNFQVPHRLRMFAQQQLKTELNNRLVRSYVDLLRARIKKGGGDVARLLPAYCPPEMLQGLRMDLNRPFGNGKDDDNDGAIDNSYEASEGASPGEKVEGFDGNSDLVNMDPIYQPDKTGPVNVQNLKRVRLIYCRQLYVLMMTLLTPTDEGYDFEGNRHRRIARQMAQWAVNVCDFRDPDGIMTRFVYDHNPFDADGWRVSETDRAAVFGCERPELIITEAIAGHDKRTEDTVMGGKVEGNDVDFDQRRKPLPWMFIELYNPWNIREAVSGELYKHRNVGSAGPVTDGVILDQVMASKNGCWRLLFHLGDEEDPDDITRASQEGDNARSFYFVTDPITLPADGSRNNWDFFRSETNGGGQVPPIRPGHCAVIGVRRRTPIGPSESGDGAGTSRPVVLLAPTSNADAPDQVQVINNGGGESRPADAKPAVAVIVDQSRRGTTPGAISGPPHGYRSPVQQQIGGMPATSTFTGDELTGSYQPPVNQPLDSRRQDVGGLLQSTKPLPGYRWCHLQRLADPTQDFNSTTNPFRTIDGIPIDLFVYNSMGGEAQDPEDDGALDFKIISRERGQTETLYPGGVNNLWTQEVRNRKAKSPGDPADPWRLYHTLGWLPKPLGQAQIGAPGGTAPGGAGGKTQPYPWLTFFNRPFINPFELMMVTDARSFELLRAPPPGPPPHGFNMRRPNTNIDPYATARGDFNHLMNFFYSGLGTVEHPIRDLAMLFDFVGVPPQFIGTEIRLDPNQSKDLPYMRPPFFNKVSSYREPGRANLNFMSSQEALHTLANEPMASGGGETETWKHFRNSRRGSSTPLGNPEEDTRFDRPFRAYGGADLTTMEGGTEPRGIDVTILRKAEGRGSGTGEGLFVPLSSEGGPDDPNRSAYFRYQRLMRVGSTTTPRSNTFAIWITVGYFEVEPVAKSEAIPDGYRLGQEAGWDTGNVNRHRAFYIVDRTIPVACQPGKIHNVHKCILVNRLIE